MHSDTKDKIAIRAGLTSIRSLYTNRHTQFLIHRLLYSLPLLAGCCEHGEGTIGRLVINVGDLGGHPGLGFSDNRAQFFLVPDAEFLKSEGYAAIRDHFNVEFPGATASRWHFRRGSVFGHPDDVNIGWRSLCGSSCASWCRATRTGRSTLACRTAFWEAGDPLKDAIQTAGLTRPYVSPTEQRGTGISI